MTKRGNEIKSVLLALFTVGVLVWLIYTAWNDYLYGEKQPFWKGIAPIQACKVPYYTNSGCYKVLATLLDNKNAQFLLGDRNVVVHKLVCYFTTNYEKGIGEKYVFCRSWDKDDNQWDLFPPDMKV
jgi:hypothetical protein